MGGVVQYGCNLLSRANVAGNRVIEGKNFKSGNEHEKWKIIWDKMVRFMNKTFQMKVIR